MGEGAQSIAKKKKKKTVRALTREAAEAVAREAAKAAVERAAGRGTFRLAGRIAGRVASRVATRVAFAAARLGKALTSAYLLPLEVASFLMDFVDDQGYNTYADMSPQRMVQSTLFQFLYFSQQGYGQDWPPTFTPDKLFPEEWNLALTEVSNQYLEPALDKLPEAVVDAFVEFEQEVEAGLVSEDDIPEALLVPIENKVLKLMGEDPVKRDEALFRSLTQLLPKPRRKEVQLCTFMSKATRYGLCISAAAAEKWAKTTAMSG